MTSASGLTMLDLHKTARFYVMSCQKKGGLDEFSSMTQEMKTREETNISPPMTVAFRF
jgi:hypothetical protein